MTYRMTAGTLERKIYFFIVDAGVDDGGRPIPFDAQPAINSIDSLPFTNDGRYEPETDGNALCLLSRPSSAGTTAQFCRIRRTGFPQLERGGHITDLLLDPDAGLLESIHVVFFPNNVVGAEYNHYGPRLSRLANYLRLKVPDVVPSLAFRPLLRGDAARKLESLVDLRHLDFSVLPPYAEFVRQTDPSLGEAFAANRRVLERPKVLQVTLNPENQERIGFLNRMRGPLRQLIGHDGLRENAKRLQVKGKSTDADRVETIDLLKDHLIVTKRIVRLNPRSRALNSDATFQAIREAHEELRPDIDLAASLSP